VAEAWLAERRALGFPLLEGERREAWLAAEAVGEAAAAGVAGSSVRQWPTETACT
jgi:hypothetical protein